MRDLVSEEQVWASPANTRGREAYASLSLSLDLNSFVASPSPGESKCLLVFFLSFTGSSDSCSKAFDVENSMIGV